MVKTKNSENCKIMFIETYSSIKLSCILSLILKHMMEDVCFQLIYCVDQITFG